MTNSERAGRWNICSTGVSTDAAKSHPREMCASPPREIDRLYSGQHFGERALLKREGRMASARSAGGKDSAPLECLTLSAEDFEDLGLQVWSLTPQSPNPPTRPYASTTPDKSPTFPPTPLPTPPPNHCPHTPPLDPSLDKNTLPTALSPTPNLPLRRP